MYMKVAVFGVGFLGSKLINFFSSDYDVVGADIKPHNNRLVRKLDATDKKEVKLFQQNFHLVPRIQKLKRCKS